MSIILLAVVAAALSFLVLGCLSTHVALRGLVKAGTWFPVALWLGSLLLMVWSVAEGSALAVLASFLLIPIQAVLVTVYWAYHRRKVQPVRE